MLPLAWGVVYGGRRRSASEKMTGLETSFAPLGQSLKKPAAEAAAMRRQARDKAAGPPNPARATRLRIGIRQQPRAAQGPGRIASGSPLQMPASDGRAISVKLAGGVELTAPAFVNMLAMRDLLEGAVHCGHEGRSPK